MKLLLAVALAAALAAAPIPRVEDGRSRFTVCIAGGASPSERRAAAKLQHFPQRMSGARLPIRTDAEAPRGPLVLVGRGRTLDALGVPVPCDKLGPEGFAVKTAPPHVVIAGGRLRGTMYGVSEFLERLGRRILIYDSDRPPRRPVLYCSRACHDTG